MGSRRLVAAGGSTVHDPVEVHGAGVLVERGALVAQAEGEYARRKRQPR